MMASSLDDASLREARYAFANAAVLASAHFVTAGTEVALLVLVADETPTRAAGVAFNAVTLVVAPVTAIALVWLIDADGDRARRLLRIATLGCRWLLSATIATFSCMVFSDWGPATRDIMFMTVVLLFVLASATASVLIHLRLATLNY